MTDPSVSTGPGAVAATPVTGASAEEPSGRATGRTVDRPLSAYAETKPKEPSADPGSGGGIFELRIEEILAKQLGQAQTTEDIEKVIQQYGDHRARTEHHALRRGDADLRRNMATRIVVLFSIANIIVLGLLGTVFFSELIFYALIYGTSGADRAAVVEHLKWGDRSVNSTAVTSIIGATTVQLGTVMVVIIRYIFPKSGDPSSETPPPNGDGP
ncbi:MAG: hypothetical protein ACFB6R_07180 [Alphaproteobacteria bacterium]